MDFDLYDNQPVSFEELGNPITSPADFLGKYESEQLVIPDYESFITEDFETEKVKIHTLKLE